jgi:hypothetical protein
LTSDGEPPVEGSGRRPDLGAPGFEKVRKILQETAHALLSRYQKRKKLARTGEKDVTHYHGARDHDGAKRDGEEQVICGGILIRTKSVLYFINYIVD